MILSKIKLYNFRNLKNQTINFSGGVNLIIGRNGQGKTNTLEAVNILSTARSFRTSKLSETIGWGQSEASVFGDIVYCNGLETSLGVSLEKKTRKGFINNELVRSVDEFIGKLACVTFTPSDLELVRGGPAERRRFLDKALSFLNPKYIRTLSSYNTALRSKNTILRDGRGKISNNLINQIASWNTILCKHGADILKSRREFIDRLIPTAKEIYNKFTPNEETMGLLLKSARIELEPSYFLLHEEMTEAIEREINQGRSLVGPHRDDLIITLSGNDSRAFASQGQTRSIVLALKLALIEEIRSVRGEPPVILLDDVDSELDSGRREHFFKSILDCGSQIIITATNSKEIPLPESEINRMEMADGEIK